MTRVFLVDDSAFMRERMKQVLAEEESFIVSGEASCAQTALTGVAQAEPDVVLLDISLPGRSGLSILGSLKQLVPDLLVLMVTTHREDQYVRKAIKGGAAGYLVKDEADDELLPAIAQIVQGNRYLSPSISPYQM